MAGWIKLHRELLDKAIWKESTPEQKVVLITLLLMANHQEKEWEWKGEIYKAKPGQFVTSLPSIQKKCGKGISIQNIRTALSRFSKYGFLTDQSTNRNRLITIVNWGLYQTSDDELTGELTGNQQATNRQLTANKNDKNNKNNIYRAFDHLSMTVEEYERLLSEGYTKEEIDDTLDQIENYKDNKRYKSLVLTCRNWIKRNREKKRHPVNPVTTPKVVLTAEERSWMDELLRRQVERNKNAYSS